MIQKHVQGVLVEVVEKQFMDGGKGYFCTLLTPTDTLVQFWAPSAFEGKLVEHSVERYTDALSQSFVLRRRIFDGKEKLALVEITA